MERRADDKGGLAPLYDLSRPRLATAEWVSPPAWRCSPLFSILGNNSKIAKLNWRDRPQRTAHWAEVAYCGVRSERRGMAGTLRTPLMFRNKARPPSKRAFILRPAAIAPTPGDING